MTHAPVGRQAQGLFAIKDIANDVRSEEGQIDQLVNPAVCCTLGHCNLGQRSACFDLFEPEMRFSDVLDQGFIRTAGSITKNQLCLNAALSDLKWRCDDLQLLVNLSWSFLVARFLGEWVMAVSSDDQRGNSAATEQSPEVPGEPYEYLSRALTLPLGQTRGAFVTGECVMKIL